MKRTLAVLALTGSLAMMSGGAAMAVTYPAPPPGVGVSDGTVTPGQAVVFSGTGFTPGERVTVNVSLAGRAGSAPGVGSRSVPLKITLPTELAALEAIADAEGKFSLPITLSETGVYTLTATGLTSGRTQSTTVTVIEAQAPVSTTDDLAKTGADPNLYLWGGIGAVALAAGAASVIIVRRKASLEETA